MAGGRPCCLDFAELYAEQAVKQAEAEGKPAAEVEKTRSEMAKFVMKYKNPLYNFGMTLLRANAGCLLFR